MKKVVSLFLCIAAVFCLIAGTAFAADEKPTWGLKPFETRQTLRLGFFTGSPLSYPFLFADKLGVFDALNIDVKYTCFTGGPAMLEANAEWDMASMGLGGLAIGLSGYDFQMIDANDYEDNLAIFVRPDSAIAKDPKNPEVWKGVTCVYPSGTTAQAVLAAYLNSIGLTLADVKSVNMDNANALTGFKGGTGDVLGCWNAIALSAEDAGFVRVSDSGKLNMGMICGTFAQKEFLKNNADLAATAIALFHLATEWVYASEDNLKQAAAWYYEHCEEEGFLCTEDVALRTMKWFRGPTVDQYIAKFTKTSPDKAGIYKTRDLLDVEQDILLGFDFFVSEGKYKPEDRTKFLDDRRVDQSVATAVKNMLGK